MLFRNQKSRRGRKPRVIPVNDDRVFNPCTFRFFNFLELLCVHKRFIMRVDLFSKIYFAFYGKTLEDEFKRYFGSDDVASIIQKHFATYLTIRHEHVLGDTDSANGGDLPFVVSRFNVNSLKTLNSCVAQQTRNLSFVRNYDIIMSHPPQ
uniref:Uncharacterized protein n=1 Tax=Panagrellus redivivus TaxID=6233 RepID=A0A7E4W7G1_PANRE